MVSCIKYIFKIVCVLLLQFSFAQSNRCSIKVNDKYGFIDTLGNVVIATQFDNAIQFSENLAIVRNGTKYGFIDTSGKIAIELKYDMANSFKDGYASVILKNKCGLIDKKGTYILKPKYDFINFYNENIVGVKLKNNWAFYNIETSLFISDFKYEEIGEFRNGLAVVEIEKLYGFINKSGKLVIPAIYQQVVFNAFYDGLAAIRSPKNHLYGFIDTTGALVIDFKFDDAVPFLENKTFVKEKWNERGYFINKKGKKIFDKTFDGAFGFQEGLSAVKINNKYGIIDSLGNWVTEPAYDWMHVYFNNGWIAFFNKINDKALWGIINAKGKIVFDAQFSSVIQNDGACILPEVYLGECDDDVNHCKKGYVNLQGKIIWTPTK